MSPQETLCELWRISRDKKINSAIKDIEIVRRYRKQNKKPNQKNHIRHLWKRCCKYIISMQREDLQKWFFLAMCLDFDDKVFERFLFLCFLILRGKIWFKGEKKEINVIFQCCNTTHKIPKLLTTLDTAINYLNVGLSASLISKFHEKIHKLLETNALTAGIPSVKTLCT